MVRMRRIGSARARRDLACEEHPHDLLGKARGRFRKDLFLVVARDDGRVISNFVMQALSGEPITIYGDGSQTRSFCYVDDMIEAMIRFMDTPSEVTGPVNLGNPQEYSILELARLIVAMTRSSSTLVFAPLPADDPRQRKPDIEQARQLLKWAPSTPIRDGLTQTIAYFEAQLRSGDGA